MAFNTTILDRQLKKWISQGMDFYHATLLMKCVTMLNCHMEADESFKEKCLDAFGNDDFEMITLWQEDNNYPEDED